MHVASRQEGRRGARGEAERAIELHARQMEALGPGDYGTLAGPQSWGSLTTHTDYPILNGEHLAHALRLARRPSWPQRYKKRHWRALAVDTDYP